MDWAVCLIDIQPKSSQQGTCTTYVIEIDRQTNLFPREIFGKIRDFNSKMLAAELMLSTLVCCVFPPSQSVQDTSHNQRGD